MAGSPQARPGPGGRLGSAARRPRFPRRSVLGRAGELITVIQRLSLARSVPEIQAIVRSAARQLTGADGATFVLGEPGACYYADEDAISPLWKGQRFAREACISGWVMTHRQAAAIEDVFSDPRIPRDVYQRTFVRSMAMVPIRRLDPLGAIGNYWASPHRATAEELELLQALADTTAVAIENVRFYQQLRDSQLETLHRLALVAEYRDDNTYQHTERVARTAYLLAQRLGVSPVEAAVIRQATPLHDVGKLAVPDSVLLKPGRLSQGEYEQIKRHTAVGAAILAGNSFVVLRRGEEIARSHHERWDGGGYPNGLARENIPLSGRIVALADIFDALTHARCYKPAWDTERAIEEIVRLRGRQLDPDVVDAFADLDSPNLVDLPDDWAPAPGTDAPGPEADGAFFTPGSRAPVLFDLS
jgi:putative two-component system response regulator